MSTSGGAEESRRPRKRVVKRLRQTVGTRTRKGYENFHRTNELHHRPGRRRSGEEIGKATRVAPGRTDRALAGAIESNALAGVESISTNGLIDYCSRSITVDEVKRHDPGKDAGEQPSSDPMTREKPARDDDPSGSVCTAERPICVGCSAPRSSAASPSGPCPPLSPRKRAEWILPKEPRWPPLRCGSTPLH